MTSFSPRHRFADWPNLDIPAVAAGVYAIWDSHSLIYCGMSGREIEKAADKRRYGLDRLPLFASGEANLDRLTKAYIHERFEYQFAIVSSSGEAYSLERRCREGQEFGVKPLLNPA
jgi:hypothetical protein